jgi:4-oxalocrotonate tautomerase
MMDLRYVPKPVAGGRRPAVRVPICNKAKLLCNDAKARVTAVPQRGWSRAVPTAARNALAWGGPAQEGSMPEVVFYALGGRSVDQKRALIKDFTDAVVKNYNVDASAVTITIVESAKEDKAKGGVLFSDMPAAKK